jgi:hypothetical protein
MGTGWHADNLLLARLHSERADFPLGAASMCGVIFDEMIIIGDAHINMTTQKVDGFSDRLPIHRHRELLLRQANSNFVTYGSTYVPGRGDSNYIAKSVS